MPSSPTFVEGTGRVMKTVPPNDASYNEMLNALVQEEPAEALDPELAGQFAAIGIVKGMPFEPDDHTRHVLEQAAGAIQEQFSHELGTAYNLRGKGLKAPYPGLIGPGEVRLAAER